MSESESPKAPEAPASEASPAEAPQPESTSIPAAADRVEPVAAEPAAAADAESATSPADEPASATTAAPATDAGEPAEAAAATEAAAEKAEGSAQKKPAKRRRKRPHAARAEEFVPPTPEDLAGISSDVVREAVEQSLPVAGKIIGWNQGGFHAVVSGISAFCPRSSMELGAPREPAQYLDQEYLFRVLRVEEKGHRLVLSRAAVLRDEKRHQVEEMKKSLEVGAVVHGLVASLHDFGAFVDLGGIEGLIHVSEIRHQRIGHPKEALEVGQEIDAKVVKLPAKGERVSLSLRALEPSPWQGVDEKWPAGGKFTGKVLRKSDFGWFVELAPGVEGLLHVSQLPPGTKPDDPSLEPGAAIEGWVREVDPRRHRISLALREVPAGDPWQGVDRRYPEAAVVTGKIEKVAPFGAFIELEPGLTALFPTSEMGLPRGASVAKAYPIGREIKLKVSEVDARRKRISLTRVEKTLEGSKSDYQAYSKRARKSDGLGALAAAFERLKSPNG
jgi:small subunit ribosomal protein S1